MEVTFNIWHATKNNPSNDGTFKNTQYQWEFLCRITWLARRQSDQTGYQSCTFSTWCSASTGNILFFAIFLDSNVYTGLVWFLELKFGCGISARIITSFTCSRTVAFHVGIFILFFLSVVKSRHNFSLGRPCHWNPLSWICKYYQNRKLQKAIYLEIMMV